MPLILYHFVGSSPCSAVRLLCKLLDIDVVLKNVDLSTAEHLKPEFLTLNPQHTVPTMVDDQFVLWESRAILIYLTEKYAKIESLYPKDPQIRAIVNQRLFFDMGTLFQRFTDAYLPFIIDGVPIDDVKFKKIHEAFTLLDGFLSKSTFVAGKNLTIADISLVPSVTTAQCTGFDLSLYPNIIAWLEKCKLVLPSYDEINGISTAAFRQYLNTVALIKNISASSKV